MREHAAVAIQNGSQFLIAAQQPDGFWRDYLHYRHLRDQHAVSFLKCMQWVAVTRHADVARVLRSPGEFLDDHAQCDGDVRSLTKLLLIAGNETTTNLMSNAMLALLTTPGLQQRLRDQPWLCRAWDR